MRSSFTRVGATALVAGALFLAGCGGGGGDGTIDRAGVNDPDKGAGAGRLVDWTLFGRVLERTHYLPAPEKLNPPLKKIWSYNDRALIEFPPAVYDGTAYVVDKYGNVRAIRLTDRKVLWDIQRDHRDVGPPSDVTAPVYSDGHVYVAFESGVVASLDSESGKVVWKRDLHSRLESSPIVVGDALYIGSDKTDLFSLATKDGKVEWQFKAPAPVKASPSYSRGQILVGDYAGTMYSVDAGSGKLRWKTDTTQVAPGGSGGFYSSPAIAYGLVFAARDDGTVYAFDFKDGHVNWSFVTNGAVYGSPAVAQVPGTPPTVYIGSYDGKLYALKAKSGRREWDFEVGGPVPGTAVVIGHTVYTSSFATNKSIGIDVRSHNMTFSIRSPGYTPMISDGRKLYLVGYYTIKGLAPR